MLPAGLAPEASAAPGARVCAGSMRGLSFGSNPRIWTWPSGAQPPRLAAGGGAWVLRRMPLRDTSRPRADPEGPCGQKDENSACALARWRWHSARTPLLAHLHHGHALNSRTAHQARAAAPCAMRRAQSSERAAASGKRQHSITALRPRAPNA